MILNVQGSSLKKFPRLRRYSLNGCLMLDIVFGLRLAPISPPILHNFQQLTPKQQELAKLANIVARVLVALVPPGPQCVHPS